MLQHLVVLGHVPGQDARRDVQKMQVFFEVVEDVANDFLLIIAINIIGLPAAAQEDQPPRSMVVDSPSFPHRSGRGPGPKPAVGWPVRWASTPG